MKPIKHIVLVLILCVSNYVLSQQVSVDNTIPVQQLIENNLADGCVEISNVTSSLNGSVDGFTSYGSFQRASSNFPLSNGIVISTGNAASGGNTVNDTDLSDGTLNWGTDPDIETFLGVSNTVNATVIEFDFVSLSDMIQFNYILASEEYFANYPCNSSDGFVFLIREASTSAYQNIALVPGTSTPVTISNIHDVIPTQCAASNDQYFDGYDMNDTNYNGRTNILTAGTSVLPNVQYHVKLIVADQSNTMADPSVDTAVFIEASTFTELELGDDINTCSGSVTLDGEIQNPLASYSWFRDNIQISGETNPLLTTSISGLYRVEINISGITCTIEDEVLVTIDTELTTNPISNYELCDSNGDNQEIFDLSTKNIDVENAIQNLPQNYTISYYLTDSDARNNPGNNITTPLNSTSRTIYVRVEDSVNGCLIYGTFALVVNPLPIVIQPMDLNVCDNDNIPNTSTAIDLSQRDFEITGGNGNLLVTYHFTQLEAGSGANPISLPYYNTNPSETLYARVINSVTGCEISTATLTINVTNGNTGIVREPQFIDACDTDHDGSAVFDITQVLSDILNGQTGFLPPTYHVSQSDAESGINPIPNPQNYVNTNPNEQIIYLRLVDSSTGCHAIVPIEIHTNLLLTGTNIPPTGFAFCDQDNDGSVDVYLNTIENVIANGLPNIAVTFYETQSDRDNNIMPVTANPYIITGPQTLYLRIENGLCTELSEVILRINPVITFSPVEPIDYCDTDDDGFTTIDFDSFDATITAGTPDFSVRYFLDPSDADTGVNQLPRFYDSISDTFYARIENTITGCYTVNEFQVNVIPAPTVTQPNNEIICDNDQDGFSIINLDDKVSEIVSDPTGLIIDFFDDYNNANNNVTPISIVDRPNYNSDTQTIYVRVQTTASSGCYTIVAFDVIVNTLPVIPNISPFQICVDQGTSAADFFFQDKDAEILNGQTGKEVYYFQDAAFSMPLDKTIAYNSSGSETIYVRVENITDPSCNSTSSFILEIGSNPIYNTNFSDFPPVCQNGVGNHTFDLEAKRQEIAQGSPDTLDIQFYLTNDEAENNASTTLPNQYTSQVLQGQFYVRIQNTSNSCFVIDEVRFITFPSPAVTSSTIEPVCDVDYDGIAEVDLTNAVFQIDNVRFSDITITYYEDEALTMQIPLSQINNYTVDNSQTIYVKAENTSTQCADSASLDLQITLPPVLNTIGTIPICDNDTSTYDLSQINDLVVDDTSAVTISYHSSSSDAINNNAPLNSTFNYTASNHIIYLRIVDINNNCPAFTSFNLQINPNPIANTPPDMEDCDDDYDGFFAFDLSLQDNAILGTQSPANFTVTYFNSIASAESNDSDLGLSHSAFDGEIIYARVENNTTGCYNTTQFSTIVNPLPIINVDDVEPLCINDLPLTIDAETGIFGDTYLWSTGETTPQIQLGLSDIGDYWITITSALGCDATKAFSVIESAEATINFTTTVDFADPNRITVDVGGIGDYVYILDHGPEQTSNVFNNVSLGLHTVTVRDLNGCRDVEQDVVVIDVPKFMTPNADGYFDTWHIVGIEQLAGTIVYIYDRHGKLMKTLPHTSIGWDGTFNGQLMPSNDYWFLAEVQQNGNAFEVKGHFTLKR